MKYLVTITTFLCLLILTACNSNESSGNKSSNQSTTQLPTEEETGIRSSAGRDYTHMRGSALSILDHRISNDPDKFYSIIETGIWEYYLVHDGTGMSKRGDNNGRWVDFKDDLTYEKGKYDKVEEKGKYHYKFDDGILLMIPDDQSKNPEEWDIKFGSDVMIMIGRQEYGINHIQQKLERRNNRKELTR